MIQIFKNISPFIENGAQKHVISVNIQTPESGALSAVTAEELNIY